MASERFVDTGIYLIEFLDDVWVRCPRCQAPAHVRTPEPYWQSQPRFTCPSCALTIEGRHTRWYGPAAGRASGQCTRCDRPFHRTLEGRDSTPKEIDVRCEGCGATRRATVNWSFHTGTRALEPSFGLDLRLQTPCMGETLWAYNDRHVDFLTTYVTATLRERTANHNASLVSRLPPWMKLAKNRRTVLRSLERLRSDITA